LTWITDEGYDQLPTAQKRSPILFRDGRCNRPKLFSQDSVAGDVATTEERDSDRIFITRLDHTVRDR
jgi:hypothetical protein